MKRKTLFIVASLLAIMPCFSLASEPSITVLEDQFYYGGFMPQCLSANGKYVCGSSFSQVGFISEWQNRNNLVCNGRDGAPFASTFNYVTDEGRALSGSLVDFHTGKSERLGLGGFVDMMTEDGSIFVGMTPNKRISEFGSAHYIEYDACYWENGKLHVLPVPTEEELGYYYLRTRARCVSADGSVILGEIIDRLYLLPMIIWRRQADGSYELDAVCKDYFSDIKYNEGYYKDYVTFQGCALSKNGKWVAMILRPSPEYGKPATASLELALYNVETGELTKANIPDDFNIAPTPHYFIYYNGVSDDGTVVGYYENDFGGESAFIMHRDDMTPVNFIEEFHTIGQFADFDEYGLNRVSCITPDGRYICGYGWMDDYVGYVFDRGMTDAEYTDQKAEPPFSEDASVISIDTFETGGETQYFDISGRRSERPVKGVNIVRRPGFPPEKIVF